MDESKDHKTFIVSRPEGLIDYQLDPSDGTVRHRAHTEFKGKFNALAMNAQGTRLYAVRDEPADDDNTGTLYTFERPEPGAPMTQIDRTRTFGKSPCEIAVSLYESRLAVSNFRGNTGRNSQGSVAVYKVGDDGKPHSGAAVRFPGSGPRLPRQEASHPHSSVFTESPLQLRVADLGTDSIWTVDPEKVLAGEITDNDLERFATEPGSGPRQIADMMNGHALFVTMEMSGSLLWLKPGLDMKLEAVKDMPLHGGAPADVKISPDYRNVYASVRSNSTLVGFQVETTDLLIREIGRYESGGNGPRWFAISGDGKLLAVSHTGSGNVAVFHRDADTGELKPLDVDIPGGGPIAAID